MINIEKSKQELIKYVENQKIDNPRTQKKLEHIIRVSNISKELATKLNLSEKQIQLAELIGLLHDIGRFEQYKIVDKEQKFNHGEAGVSILRKNNYIRNYIKENEFDDIIYTAVYEHNRYKLSKGITEEKKLFCQIIKDADKIDIIYEGANIYWKKLEDIKEIEAGNLSKKMLDDFNQYKLADIRNKVSKTDEILRFTSFVFDINFSYSFKVIKENNNINKMIDRFKYQIPETKESMSRVKNIANEYIVKKAN